MWDWMMKWLPDGKAGTFEVRDWVNVAVAVAGALIAYFAYRLTVQTAEIAAKQDKYLEEERAKHARFELTSPEVSGQIGSAQGLYTLWLTNTGRRAAQGYWYLGIPKQIKSQVTVTTEEGTREVPVLHNADIRDSTFDDPGYSGFHDDYALMKFKVTDEVAPLDRKLCATVVINIRKGEDENHFRRTFLWFTQTADERFPASGLNEMLMAVTNEYWLKYGSGADDRTPR